MDSSTESPVVLPDGETLIVTPTFHPEKVGTPHYVTDLVRGFVQAGQHCRILTSQPYYPSFERFEGFGRGTRHGHFEGTPVHRVPTIVPRGGRAWWRALSEANFLVQAFFAVLIRRVPRADRVLAISPGVPLAVLAAAVLRRSGGVLVTVVHDIQFGLVATTGGRFRGMLAVVARRGEVWSLNRSAVVAVLSEEMRQALVSAGVTVEVVVVPLWPTVESPAGISPIEGTVLYSGNLGRKQGIGFLIEVAERLAQRAPSARLIIRGDGPDREELGRHVRDRELVNVTFDDLVPEDQLAMALSEAAVHVVPQLPEGAQYAVPSKIYNILAVGRPVVVTAERHSTMARLAEEVDAVRVVDPGDSEAFVTEVTWLLERPEERRRLGHDARDWIAATHTRDNAVQAYLGLLRRSEA